MKRIFALVFLSTGIWSQNQGDLGFSIGGAQYDTRNAQAVVKNLSGKKRLMIAVKDVESRFMLVLTADVNDGEELQPMNLNTQDSTLTFSLRTRRGVLAVMPQVQLVKPDAQMTYVERTERETGELEDAPEPEGIVRNDEHRKEQKQRHKRKKIRAEYRRVKPKWHTMTKKERLQNGEGVVRNNSFRDTFFAVQLVPVVTAGKVVAYTGTFSGAGRFSGSVTGSDIQSIHNGKFHVKVENAR